KHPIRIENYSFITDSCGAGECRGGLEIARGYRLLNEESVLQLRADRVKIAPYGLAGGKPSRKSQNILNAETENRGLPGKVSMEMKKNDVIRHEQAGGGGYGDPFKRDPQAVANDVFDEKITIEYAERE